MRINALVDERFWEALPILLDSKVSISDETLGSDDKIVVAMWFSRSFSALDIGEVLTNLISRIPSMLKWRLRARHFLSVFSFLVCRQKSVEGHVISFCFCVQFRSLFSFSILPLFEKFWGYRRKFWGWGHTHQFSHYNILFTAPPQIPLNDSFNPILREELI